MSGSVEVSGISSTWAGLGDIDVARFGSGTLTIDLGAVVTSTNGVPGSEPLLGQQITILTGLPVSDTFDVVNAPIAVDVTYERGAVVVTALEGGAPTPGDVDGDGIVGITDFLTLLANWGPITCP